MLLPDKLFSYNESTLSKLPLVMKELRKQPMGVHELYQKVISNMDGVNEFIDVLDCLYALQKIEYVKLCAPRSSAAAAFAQSHMKAF